MAFRGLPVFFVLPPPFLGSPPHSQGVPNPVFPPPQTPATMQLFVRAQSLHAIEVSGAETIAQIKVSPPPPHYQAAPCPETISG